MGPGLSCKGAYLVTLKRALVLPQWHTSAVRGLFHVDMTYCALHIEAGRFGALQCFSLRIFPTHTGFLRFYFLRNSGLHDSEVAPMGRACAQVTKVFFPMFSPVLQLFYRTSLRPPCTLLMRFAHDRPPCIICGRLQGSGSCHALGGILIIIIHVMPRQTRRTSSRCRAALSALRFVTTWPPCGCHPRTLRAPSR